MAEITIEFTGQKEDIDEFTEALFEKDSVGTGTQKEIPGGGTITMGGRCYVSRLAHHALLK
jgi:hypothetical protein